MVWVVWPIPQLSPPNGPAQVSGRLGKASLVKKAQAAEKTDGATVDAEVFKDLRGVQCPLNFVKVKLALDPMQVGQTMHVLLDDGEPIRNVPRSSTAEGHKILAQERMADGHWSVGIEKGVG